MTFKTIFIIIVSVLLTIVLMNNTEEISFWIFDDVRIPKLTVLGVTFAFGLIVGFILGRPRKKTIAVKANDFEPEQDHDDYKTIEEEGKQLSDEDREYLR